MKIQEILENILKGSRYLGTFDLQDLLQFAAAHGVHGIAVSKGHDRELYFAFQEGEAQGAVYIDEKGVLFGDTAVLMIAPKEKYVLTENNPDVVEALVMGSRIFDKNRLKKSTSYDVPEIGGPTGGIGVLSVILKKEGIPQNGIRVSLRKDGKIVGSDITTNDGTVTFRVAYGTYDCIIQDKKQMVTKHRIEFDASHPSLPLET
jgi:hypothetical protein